jgi:atypical dual specificity phosphatase
MNSSLEKMDKIYLKYNNIPYEQLKPIKIFDWLYLGNLKDAIEFKGDAILSIITNPQQYSKYFSGKEWAQIDINDDPNEDILKYFQGAIEFLDKIHKEGKTCMIHCYAGINRSGTIALIYYIYKTNKNVFEAYDELSKKRPGIISNIGFRRQILLWSFDNNYLNCS